MLCSFSIFQGMTSILSATLLMPGSAPAYSVDQNILISTLLVDLLWRKDNSRWKLIKNVMKHYSWTVVESPARLHVWNVQTCWKWKIWERNLHGSCSARLHWPRPVLQAATWPRPETACGLFILCPRLPPPLPEASCANGKVSVKQPPFKLTEMVF